MNGLNSQRGCLPVLSYKNSLISESADDFLSLCSNSTPENTGSKNQLKRQKVYLV